MKNFKFSIILLFLLVSMQTIFSQETSYNQSKEYLVTFEIKQSTFTLDIFEHIKNNINSIEVTIPVDKRYYNKLRVGQQLSDDLKIGSLLVNGDFSWLKVTVIKKEIK